MRRPKPIKCDGDGGTFREIRRSRYLMFQILPSLNDAFAPGVHVIKQLFWKKSRCPQFKKLKRVCSDVGMNLHKNVKTMPSLSNTVLFIL